MWIKKPSNARSMNHSTVSLVNLNTISFIRTLDEENNCGEWELMMFTVGANSVCWYFKTEQERDKYIKENLERYMEVTV